MYNAQTFLPGSTTILYIPCGRRNTFLDPQQSYIKFNLLNYDTTGPINVDGCAASLINRIDTFHASNLLESIIQYNVLYNFLIDFQTNASQKLACSNHMGFSQSTANIREGAQLTTAAAQSHLIYSA